MLTFKNVNYAYDGLMQYVRANGLMENSRNGEVISVQHPLLICFENPRERVLFDSKRRANPFFHLMEAQWMLDGRNDVEGVAKYNPRMAEFSDDGVTLNGAYGYRWFKHFGYDQIVYALEELRRDPNSRRVIVSMWDGRDDLTCFSKDKPCNTSLMFRIVDGALDMTSTNRSNDLVWGLCGANAVHLTYLQEFMATELEVPVGKWYHMTNNLHVYEHHYPLMYGQRDLIAEYPALGPQVGTPEFTERVLYPIEEAWAFHKRGDYWGAMECTMKIVADDWRLACANWLGGAKYAVK